VRLPCVHAVATTPAQRLGGTSLLLPSHISLPRNGARVGLCNDLFEACSAFTRVTAFTLAGSPIVIRYIEGFSYFVTSITAPIASGWSEIAGWDFHPLRNAALSRRTPEAVIRQAPGMDRLDTGSGPWRFGTDQTCFTLWKSRIALNNSVSAVLKPSPKLVKCKATTQQFDQSRRFLGA
jgi:hypothetical protein